MNDNLIIVTCIFFMSILWNLYFKSLKEGVDNYVMPISFSDNYSTNPSRDESRTINVPGQITSNSDLRLMKNTTVDGSLNVRDNFNSKSINVGNMHDITGIQAGSARVSGHNFWVPFPKSFSGDEVVVVTNPSGATGDWNQNFMTNVIAANKWGFNVTITGVTGGGTWRPENVTITWIAFCKGANQINNSYTPPPPPPPPPPPRPRQWLIPIIRRPPPPPPRPVQRAVNAVRRFFRFR